MSATTTQVIDTTATENQRPNFGNGPLSRETERYYDGAIERLGMTPKQAEKFARQAASDVGAALKNQTVKVKLGKTNADGKGTISQACKAKGIHYSNAMNIVRALDWMEDAGKNGISFAETDWQLVPELAKYVKQLDGE